MQRLFEPYPQAVQRSVEIADRCRFRLERLIGQFPLFAVEEGKTRQSYLRELTYRGAAARYGTPLANDVERQLEYELGIIAKMDLAGYFLIVWDIVQKAAELGVLCQGRGSAANSAVCYALGITAVDPIGMQLLFERFMSEERREIPDIDIDFAHQDREQIIQYIYDKYGRSNAAMAAEVISYRTRSALRDVAKALGLSLAQVDALAHELEAGESLEAAAATVEPIAAPRPSRAPAPGERDARIGVTGVWRTFGARGGASVLGGRIEASSTAMKFGLASGDLEMAAGRKDIDNVGQTTAWLISGGATLGIFAGRRRWRAAAGLGGRIGLVRESGSSADPAHISSSTFVRPWGGPIVNASLSRTLGRAALTIGGEAGWSLSSIDEMAAGVTAIAVRGPWVAVSVGAALRR